ncbi:MAG: MBL fold metallo-hydrolase [Nitrospirae bacterium]|nr:MBL fold metallo-hydrolase [Nitrospirota bacterium]
MIAISLQSGSNGNCIYVEAAGKRLLFDAGISCLLAEQRLAAFGKTIRDCDALIISHDHADHIRYAGVFQRKYGLPLYVTPFTLGAALLKYRLGPLGDVRHFRAGSVLHFGNLSVRTIPTMHDGADGAAFVVSSHSKRLGILTDLGYAFSRLEEVVSSLDAVFLESNYDPEMLERGPYPGFLKRRIMGPGGHLSNTEAAELLRRYGKRLKWACLAHLSETNNRPDLALRTHKMGKPDYTLYAASRYGATEILTV